MNSKIISIVIFLNFTICVLQYIFPEETSKILSYFVREIKHPNPFRGARGSSGLSAEPGFMGALGVVYMILTIYLKDYKKDRTLFKTNVLFSICIIFMSKSGTAAMLIIFFLFLYLLRDIKKISVILLFLLVIYALSNYIGRFFQVTELLLSDPYYLLFHDQSVAHRTMGILVGIFSLFENPFGFGAGSYTNAALLVTEKYKLFDIINSEFVTFGAVSVFGKFITELGILYIVLLILLLFCKKNIFNRVPYYAVAFLMILGSFSFAFPPVWLILSLKFNQRVNNYVHTRT